LIAKVALHPITKFPLSSEGEIDMSPIWPYDPDEDAKIIKEDQEQKDLHFESPDSSGAAAAYVLIATIILAVVVLFPIIYYLLTR
jgi:hypothetical protein